MVGDCLLHADCGFWFRDGIGYYSGYSDVSIAKNQSESFTTSRRPNPSDYLQTRFPPGVSHRSFHLHFAFSFRRQFSSYCHCSLCPLLHLAGLIVSNVIDGVTCVIDACYSNRKFMSQVRMGRNNFDLAGLPRWVTDPRQDYAVSISFVHLVASDMQPCKYVWATFHRFYFPWLNELWCLGCGSFLMT